MLKPPLLVRIAFHPKSEEARRLAVDLHRALNDDPAVPGLRIPTAFVPEDGTGDPPDTVPLGMDAERELVLVLADDPMVIAVAKAKAAGRGRTWGDCVYDLYAACAADPRHRFLPVQLSREGWPLDPRLAALNFLRAYAYEKEEERHAFVRRHGIHELCRHLGAQPAGTGESPPPAPVTVFLSHTKLDLEKEPFAVRDLIAYLKADQPVKAWVDSGDIEAGSPFAQRIAQGVEDAAMLVVRTDAYASREWCRREILLAKRYQRPVIVVDALCQREVRSFPYSGNVPVLRWTGAPAAAIDLLLKENLRYLHVKEALAARRCPGDEMLTNAPELVTLAPFAPGATVLYPDPPLGQEELAILEHTRVRVETPLQRFARSVERPVLPAPIALSLSESGDVEAYGLAQIHQDAAAVEISRYLLLAGATLAYAGHLAKGGYTQLLFELVRSHAIPGVTAPRPIVSYVGWPLTITDRDWAEIGEAGRFVPIPRPPGIDESMHSDFIPEPACFPPGRSALHRYAWATGMTAMRARQTAETVARVVVGGRTGPALSTQPDGSRQSEWYAGRIPGVLEEILLSLRADQPVYLVGAFGGCARLVVDLLEGRERREMTWDFQRQAPQAEAMREIYEKQGTWWDYPDMLDFVQKRGWAGLHNGLDVEENRLLARTQTPETIVELLLTGLRRCVVPPGPPAA